MSNPTYSEQYKLLQERFHIERPDYGMSGMRYADHVLQIAKRLNTKDILDYGAGKCTLAKALPFPIQSYDPFIPELTAQPHAADIVVCTDVMEHIEPEFVDSVLAEIAGLTKLLAFFQIATRRAQKFLPDGRNAHLIQEGINWWLTKLMQHFEISGVQDMQGGFVCVCLPRQPEV